MPKKWYTIRNREYEKLLRLAALLHRESVRCLGAKAYVAGCAAASAALGALLLVMLHVYADEVDAAGQVVMFRGRAKHVFDWKFSEMLRVASGMGWLPTGLPKGGKWITRRAKIGDYAEVLRQTRNLIHPARYVLDLSPARVPKRYLEGSIEVFEVASQHLYAKVLSSLRQDLRIKTLKLVFS